MFQVKPYLYSNLVLVRYYLVVGGPWLALIQWLWSQLVALSSLLAPSPFLTCLFILFSSFIILSDYIFLPLLLGSQLTWLLAANLVIELLGDWFSKLAFL